MPNKPEEPQPLEPMNAESTQEAIDQLVLNHSENDLFRMVLERKRKLVHDKQKANQPAASIAVDEDTWKKIEDYAKRPIEGDEVGPGGLDHLSMIIVDCLTAKNFDDLLFSLIRVWRKTVHLQPHLGDIDKL